MNLFSIAYPVSNGESQSTNSPFLSVGLTKNYEQLTSSADAFIVGSETGFAPLRDAKRHLEGILCRPFKEVEELADWNRFENEKTTLIAVPAKSGTSKLRGLILAPGERAKCYSKFATPNYGKPYRDFYYNVSYEAIALAASLWQASSVAISHLSGHGFNSDIATCNTEAAVHFCVDHREAAILNLEFVGCCIEPTHLQNLNDPALYKPYKHRPIKKSGYLREGLQMLDIDWSA